MTKTNALRRLEAAGIPYEIREYAFDDEHPAGLHADVTKGKNKSSIAGWRISPQTERILRSSRLS